MYKTQKIFCISNNIQLISDNIFKRVLLTMNQKIAWHISLRGCIQKSTSDELEYNLEFLILTILNQLKIALGPSLVCFIIFDSVCSPFCTVLFCFGFFVHCFWSTWLFGLDLSTLIKFLFSLKTWRSLFLLLLCHLEHCAAPDCKVQMNGK